MRLRRRIVVDESGNKQSGSVWGKWLVGVLITMVLVGYGVSEYRKSVVDPDARFHLLYIDDEGARVSLASFDPVEQKIVVIEYPPELTIVSRSVGRYEMRNLYTLGGYKGDGGEFARRKVQGFMRLPIVGHIVSNSESGEIEGSLRSALRQSLYKGGGVETNLSIFDRFRLLSELSRASVRVVGKEELVRAGILVSTPDSGWNYNSERLIKYVGASFFDWGVGQEGATVAIVNESGLDGMGSDMASFLTSMGLDVVMVRSGEKTSESTRYVIQDPKKFRRALTLIERVFTFEPYVIEETKDFRADIVFWIGKDALELF